MFFEVMNPPIALSHTAVAAAIEIYAKQAADVVNIVLIVPVVLRPLAQEIRRQAENRWAEVEDNRFALGFTTVMGLPDDFWMIAGPNGVILGGAV